MRRGEATEVDLCLPRGGDLCQLVHCKIPDVCPYACFGLFLSIYMFRIINLLTMMLLQNTI